jgi:DNA polymerase elongation subunit (family B)
MPARRDDLYAGSLFDDPRDAADDGAAPEAARILFGADETRRIVAAEADDEGLTLWRRMGDDRVVVERVPSRPWLLLAEPAPGMAVTRELEGGHFRLLCEFPSREAQRVARLYLRDRQVEHSAYVSPTKAALVATGRTLFKGMAMAEVRRMQVDIETQGLLGDAPDARVLCIAVGDNRGLEDVLVGDEPEILARLAALVAERDPDVIEGHNLLGFDIPFLLARARAHRVRLALGRDGSEPVPGMERNLALGGASRPFRPIYVHGRHLVDTYLAVQQFDAARGELAGYGLKQVARAYGIAEPNRIELDRAVLAETYRTDPSRVLEYAAQDIRETQRLAELTLATQFYQAQMVPDTYAAVAVTGSGEKINAIFVRAYLSAGRGLPQSRAATDNLGGHVETRITGVVQRVVKADVESLYPSLMLKHGIHPETDCLGVFLPALAELTRRRLEAKARVKSCPEGERHYWDGLQGSFKVLINSFYGYLGAPTFYFNDPVQAGNVTRLGRELVLQVAGQLDADGAQIIEIDTDGVYFVPPPDVEGEEAERAYVGRLDDALPEGIRLAFDGRYRAMVSLKPKNYVLQGYDGKRTLKGASLRSRADEPFGREFLERSIDLLIEGDTAGFAALYDATAARLRDHQVPIERLARRERITGKTFSSSAKQRTAALAQGVAVGEYVYVYERADGKLGLMEEFTPGSESPLAYMEKLHKFACRLREAVGPGFDDLIPRPSRAGIVRQARLDLFGDD